MRISRFLFSRVLIASVLSMIVVSTAHSQVSDSSPKPAPFFLNLYPPVYPPLARQARISGEVVLQIGVRADGSVALAEVVSGHPMLKQAALESARKSTFPPQESKEGTTLYSLTYTFGLRVDPGADCTDGGTFVRAAKCLYLWRCEWHNPPAIVSPIGESPGRVIILAPPACIETETSHSACVSRHLE
jgi:TonB family protein